MRCYCADKVPCNITTGICPGDCEEGYIGEFCQYGKCMRLNRWYPMAVNQSNESKSPEWF